MALAVAGVPRGTADVDINVFVEAGEVSRLLAALLRLGIVLDEQAAIERARRDGMFVGRWRALAARASDG